MSKATAGPIRHETVTVQDLVRLTPGVIHTLLYDTQPRVTVLIMMKKSRFGVFRPLYLPLICSGLFSVCLDACCACGSLTVVNRK